MNEFSAHGIIFAAPLTWFTGFLLLCMPKLSINSRWFIAKSCAVVGIITSLLVGFFAVIQFALNSQLPILLMLTLISFLSWVIIRFSNTYLSGQVGQERFLRAMTFTLAAVTGVVTSDRLEVMAVCWTAASFSLHRLLTFDTSRAVAYRAAKKKRNSGRLADICFILSILLTSVELGTTNIEKINSEILNLGSLPFSLQCASIFLVLAVVLKSAQIPAHGWLIQVMEAPTPVSALLHAGVVNLGGYILTREYALISASPAAQILLVTFGCFTAAVASLVTLTRVSIKVKLAWSTCAQMGFMLIQCGLGLYNLALLHILSHSIYKAHAFLSSGSIVRQQSTSEKSFSNRSITFARQFFYAVLSFGVLVSAVSAWNKWLGPLLIPTEVLLFLSLALPSLLPRATNIPVWDFTSSAGKVLAVVAITLALNAVLSTSSAFPEANLQVHSTLIFTVGIVFFTVFILQSEICDRPKSRMSQALYPYFYHGFYLDEAFSKFLSRLFPSKGIP